MITGMRRRTPPLSFLSILSLLFLSIITILSGCSSDNHSPKLSDVLHLTANTCPTLLPANRSGGGDIYLMGKPGGRIVSPDPTDAEICFYRLPYGEPVHSTLLGSQSMTPATAASIADYFNQLPKPSGGPINCPTSSGIWSALFVFSYNHTGAEGAELGSCETVGSLSGLRDRINDPHSMTPPGLFVSAIGSAYLVGTPQANKRKVANDLDRFADSL